MKKYLKTLCYSVIAWELAALFYVAVRLYGVDDSPIYQSVDPGFDFWKLCFATAGVAGVILGISVGLMDILADTKRFRRKSYGFFIFLKSVSIIILTLIISFVSVVALSIGSQDFGDLIGSFYAVTNGDVVRCTWGPA